jgi:hypothetical protein
MVTTLSWPLSIKASSHCGTDLPTTHTTLLFISNPKASSIWPEKTTRSFSKKKKDKQTDHMSCSVSLSHARPNQHAATRYKIYRNTLRSGSCTSTVVPILLQNLSLTALLLPTSNSFPPPSPKMSPIWTMETAARLET